MELYYTSKNKPANQSGSTEISSLEYGGNTGMATGGYGDYDDATKSQEWSGYYPTSSEGYSSSGYSQQSSDTWGQSYYGVPESQLASGDVGNPAQQTVASQNYWTQQSGQAAAVRPSLRPAAPRQTAPRPTASRPTAPRQVATPSDGTPDSYAKMALQMHLRMTDEKATANHPSAVAQYEGYYGEESDAYGQVAPSAYASAAYDSAPVTLRPRIPGAASAWPAMARPRGPPGTTGWPATRDAYPRMRPVFGRGAAQPLAPGTRAPAPGVRSATSGVRAAAPGIRSAAPGIRAAGPGVRSAAPGIRAAGPGVRSAAPGTPGVGRGVGAGGTGIRAAAPGIRTALTPRGAAVGARGMPAARGTDGMYAVPRATGPRGAQAPRAGTSSGPRPFALMGLQVRAPIAREPSAFESKLTKLAESTCDELGIPKTGDSFRSEDGDKTDSKAEATAINEEEEDDDDDDDDSDPNSCRICDIKFDKSQAYHVHIRSTSHHQKVEARKKAKKALTASTESTTSVPSTMTNPAVQPSPGGSEATKKGEHFCYVCSFLFSNAEMFNSHLTGMLHVQRLEEQKTAKPSMVDDEEEGDEDSQDSMMVTAFKKNDWKSVNEKDLNPDDIGKPGSTQFMCEVCNISCTGNKSYEMHIVGAKHLKKLKKTREIEDFEKKKHEGVGEGIHEELLKTKKKRKVVRVQEQLDQCSEPLIGLDYMTEFQVEDSTIEPRYICDLCQCKMDMRQIIPHVTGIKHRQKYFKYHSIREYNILWDIRRKSEKVKAATKFAEETEAREGRHKMRLKIQFRPFEDEGNKAKESEEWTEVEDAHTRPKSALPGLGGFDERSAMYKDVSEYEEEEEGDRDEGPVLDVDALRRIDPPPHLSGLSRGGSMHRPMPPSRFRPGAPLSRPLGPPLRGPRPPGPPRSSYPLPPREVAPRFPPARGYPPERRRAPMRPTDPYYQRFPGYNSSSNSSNSRYDYYHPAPAPAPPSSSSSNSKSLETRAVINYDHQSLTTDGDDYGARASGTTESTGARQESDQYSRRTEESDQYSRRTEESDQYGRRTQEAEHYGKRAEESDQYGKRPAGYEGDRRVPVERSQNSAAAAAATDADTSISSLNIDLVKAAIAQCNIDTEADAEIALQISNSLTQALLEYRLNSLAKAGTSDAALENHLKNLRQQNAEHLTTGHHPETSNLMYSALRATRALAAKLPSGDQETIKQAMSVLDAVNLQLYGMLDKGGDSAKVEEPQKRQETGGGQGEQQPSREMHTDRFRGYEHRDDEDEEYRQMGNVASVRPPSKRFRFGL